MVDDGSCIIGGCTDSSSWTWRLKAEATGAQFATERAHAAAYTIKFITGKSFSGFSSADLDELKGYRQQNLYTSSPFSIFGGAGPPNRQIW